MIGKKTIASSGVTFIAAAGLIIVACSDKPEDSGGDDTGGGTGGSAGSTGGSVTGGTAGTGPSGGVSGSTGGSITGGSAGQGGSAGSAAGSGGGGGAAASGPFMCDMPNTANCGAINDFPNSTSQTWGNSDFSGGVSVFGEGIMRDMNNTQALHITGMVGGYGRGFNIWFTLCSTLASYGGIQFTVNGTTMDPVAANTIDFQVQTNSDYPWQPFPATNAKGACTAPAGADPWGMCIAPGVNGLMLGTAAQTVMWAQVMGGMPTAWGAMSQGEIVGIQWQFPWGGARSAPYAVDVTLDNVAFVGGSGPTTACPAYMAGGGGMGGAGGTGGGAAGAAGSGAGAGSGGMGGAGAGGAGAGMAGTGGT